MAETATADDTIARLVAAAPPLSEATRATLAAVLKPAVR